MKLISDSVTQAFGKKVLQAKHNSPHIFFAAGVAGVLGGTFLACRATLKLEDTLDEIKEDVDAVKTRDRSALMDDGETYESEYSRDLVYVYAKSTVKIGRLYGPAIAVTSLSIASLTGSHVQLTRRNAALSATLAAVSKAYDEYRARVREELGEERELDIYRGVREEEVEVDGNKELLRLTDPNAWSPYARIFDEANENWRKDADYNRMFIELQQSYVNQRLHAYGHVFLNEVYDRLGFERTTAGQFVGWVKDGDGDNFIDFGLYEATADDFRNGYERNIILDFNVDGPIHEKF